jgi:hypothetical protein
MQIAIMSPPIVSAGVALTYLTLGSWRNELAKPSNGVRLTNTKPNVDGR